MIKGGNDRRLVTDVWPQICSYARSFYKEDAPPEWAKKKAYAMYAALVGHMPRADFFRTDSKEPSLEVYRKLRNMDKARFARKRAEQRRAA